MTVGYVWAVIGVFDGLIDGWLLAMATVVFIVW